MGRHRRWRFRSAAVALFVMVGCSPPSHVVVKVEDPTAAAASATQLFAGTDAAKLKAVKLDKKLAFPLQITVSASTGGEQEIIVEARQANGTALARGQGPVTLKRKGSPFASIELAQICEEDEDCFDDLFCDGTGLCRGGLCEYEAAPCASNFPCVISTCLEEAKACHVTVDHSLCPGGSYCDTGGGCIDGPSCMPENHHADCQDASVCNGEEQCVSFHCVGGSAPTVSDGDVCTLDGCDDNRVVEGMEAVFHFAVNSLDGSECDIPSTDPPARGVCVSAKGGCVASECGDAVVFAGASEVCDEGVANNDAWSLTRHCNATCTTWAPFCGDENTDSGFETCDQGAANGSGTGCSATCQRDGTCGDGQVQTVYEQCDDQNSDECDGCRSDCTRGCNCFAPNPCSGSNWCSQGECVSCDVPAHCSSSCVACPTTTPLCGSVVTGCVCDPTPLPQGSCGHGAFCLGVACAPCDDVQRCGQDCVACSGDTPVCGGAEVGCVVDPATDPPSRGCAGKPDFTLCRVASPSRSYDICMNGTCVEPGCGDATCNAHGPSFAQADVVTGWEYPDTNQRVCYNNTAVMACTPFPCDAGGGPAFCGQDAQYGWDTTHSDPEIRWTRTGNDEPVVVDGITSLMWQGCSGGRSGSMCADGGNYVYTWQEALTYCDGLVWGGYADWRLPDPYELRSIVDLGRVNPAIDGTAFPGTPADWFWSSSSYAAVASGAWRVYFGVGNVNFTGKSVAHYARCVRLGPSTPASLARFSRSDPLVNGQPVVADGKTKLMWQGCAAGMSDSFCGTGSAATYTWELAMSYCEALTWGGYADWRLPDSYELQSIVDLGRLLPAIDGTAFPGTPANWFWLSTSYAGVASGAWRVTFIDGDVNYNGKSNAYCARCVRLGPI